MLRHRLTERGSPHEVRGPAGHSGVGAVLGQQVAGLGPRLRRVEVLSDSAGVCLDREQLTLLGDALSVDGWTAGGRLSLAAQKRLSLQPPSTGMTAPVTMSKGGPHSDATISATSRRETESPCGCPLKRPVDECLVDVGDVVSALGDLARRHAFTVISGPSSRASDSVSIPMAFFASPYTE